jgi:hypothetical protein
MPNDIVIGYIRVTGWIHGRSALNAIVTYYDDPENWFMKQFVSQEQLEKFARENSLAIQRNEGESE